VNDNPHRVPIELNTEYVNTLAYKIFNLKAKDLDFSEIDPHGLLSTSDLEEDPPETHTERDTVTSAPVVVSVVSVKIGDLFIILRSGGSVEIGEYRSAETVVEGLARVSISENGMGSFGLKVFALG